MLRLQKKERKAHLTKLRNRRNKIAVRKRQEVLNASLEACVANMLASAPRRRTGIMSFIPRSFLSLLKRWTKRVYEELDHRTTFENYRKVLGSMDDNTDF